MTRLSTTKTLKALALTLAALALPAIGHAETSLQSRVDHCTGASMEAVQAHSIAMLAAADGLVVNLQDPLASAPSSEAWCAVAMLAWRDGLDISGSQLDTLIAAAPTSAGSTALATPTDEFTAMAEATAGLR